MALTHQYETRAQRRLLQDGSSAINSGVTDEENMSNSSSAPDVDIVSIREEINSNDNDRQGEPDEIRLSPPPVQFDWTQGSGRQPIIGSQRRRNNNNQIRRKSNSNSDL